MLRPLGVESRYQLSSEDDYNRVVGCIMYINLAHDVSSTCQRIFTNKKKSPKIIENMHTTEVQCNCAHLPRNSLAKTKRPNQQNHVEDGFESSVFSLVFDSLFFH